MIYVQHPARWVELIPDPKGCTSPDLIIEPVSIYFGISYDSMKSKTRKRDIVYARQMTMFMLREFTRLSLKKVGELFGDRDHTSVIHSVNTINDLCETDALLRLQREEITRKVADFIK